MSTGSGSEQRVIGLLGGMSWQSTAEYYRLVNELVAERLGGLHSARCVLYSVDFAPIAAAQAAQRWDEAVPPLAEAADALVRAGADVVVMCTNTMHLVAPRLAERLPVPLLHIGEVTARAVVDAGVRRVGLLGTAFTMEKSFYRDLLAGHGVETVTPEPRDRETVHRIIYEELCRGVFTESSRREYLAVADRLVARGAQGVVYGCTEIELLLNGSVAPVPVFPTTRLHAEAAVRFALGSPTDRPA
ncbi:aspartate/glutamate racemase family protein [Saccharothrix xinjiangensis]|uniref:Aspartate/glutamate racemase family protein n=1 Tax=Saccharothrix xinjiangensis TaxID=204798 RepID=A0ABV9YCP1_9PSEU